MSLSRLHKRRLSSVELAENAHMSTTDSEANALPPLPEITGAIVLETFSHASLSLLRKDGAALNNGRLSEIGRIVLDLAATSYLIGKRPLVPSEDIAGRRKEILSKDNIDKWTTQYNLHQRLRYAHVDDLDLHSKEETEKLFRAYAGAVFVQHGSVRAIEWIHNLIEPGIAPSSAGAVTNTVELVRENKRRREEPAIQSSDSESKLVQSTIVTTPSSLVTATIPISGVPVKSYLQLFNERSSQRRFSVEYRSENLGSPHAPIWQINCYVNNISKGHGQGSSKQTAKELAAKEAWYAMGWDAY